MITILPKRLDNENGFSLIIVTWIILLLSILAAGVLHVTTVSHQTVSVVRQEFENDLIAASAIEIFMNEYFAKPELQNITNETILVFDTDVDISVSYESGKINLNWSSLPVLSALFAANGINQDTSLQLAAAIIDWRDHDNEPLPSGAENETYNALEVGYTPRNGAFETIGELRHILGVTEDIFTCSLPLITVYSIENAQNGFVNISRADGNVRSIFAWAYENNWQDIEWPNPDDIAFKGGFPKDSSKSNEAITLTVSFINNSARKEYAQTLRFKNEGVSAEKPYKTLTKLQPIYKNKKQC
jgi:type II secretory pathway component PulK